MSKMLFKHALLASTVIVGFAMTASPSFAQAADANVPPVNADAANDEGEAIVVTGSRIARPDIDAAVPVAVVSEKQIQQEGATNVQDILNELPQVGIGASRTNTNFSTSANGVATLNLRNLGGNRTLVLVNGRRFIAGIAGTSQVDINNIPSDFVERIDVVTGGSSAVYGSDAIAGVVNFILRDNFEGLMARAQTNITQHGDNPRYNVSLTGGTNWGADDRGNIIVNFTYDRDEGLRSRDRDISDQDCFGESDPDQCGPASYSSYSAQGRFQLLDATGAPVAGVYGPGSTFSFGPSNNLIAGNGVGFNRNGERYIAVPLERYLGSTVLNYDLTDDVELFAEATYSKVKGNSRLEAFAMDYTDIYAGEGTDIGMPLTNPFIPAAVRAAITAANSDADPDNDVAALGFRRRQVDVFDRSNQVERDTWRITTGVRADLFADWTGEASYVYGRLHDFTASEDIDNNRYRNALDAIVDPVSGQIVCRSVAARAEGCVPINLFGYNTVSPQAAAYVKAVVPKSQEDVNTMHVLSASASGTLFRLPAGNVGVALGAEYRKEKSVSNLDILSNTGGNSGNEIPDTAGEFDVKEVYGEINVPILADTAFFNYLGVTAAARYSDYSTVGGVFSWNVGAEWSPVESLRLRAMYAVANRAPNIGELFTAPSESFPSGITDPCAGVTATSTRPLDAACRAIPGVAASIAANGSLIYDLSDIQGINGYGQGNPNLNEETAKTLTLGAVFTPASIPGLSITVDYFDIAVNDAIGAVPLQTTIDECVRTGNPTFCQSVIRFAGTGKLRTVNSELVNVADIKTRGIDAAIRYSTPLGLAADDRLDFSLAYTRLLKLEQVTFPGNPAEENVGQLGSGSLGRLGAGFKDKASARAAYRTGGTTVSWQVNYLGKIRDTLSPEDADANNDPQNVVGDSFYHDIQVRQAVGPNNQFEFYVGIDNAFDNNPPFLPGAFASSITGTETAADTFDPFGRRFYAGFQVRF